MDILTALNENSTYSDRKLQLIVGAWVASAAFEKQNKVKMDDGDVSEDDYNKQSIYSLLYAMYRSVGDVRTSDGKVYEMTFNTWGYDWPKGWGDPNPNIDPNDPQRFGMYAYSGLCHWPEVQEYVAERNGHVHFVELGCGTGAGAHHICMNEFPKATYEAVDMQAAAIETCKRRHVNPTRHRLQAIHADATKVDIRDESADIVVVCETHVTEYAGTVSSEDKKFFTKMISVLKPGGYLCWGNAIPADTWGPCFEYLESIGMKMIHNEDVTAEAIVARQKDEGRAEAFVEACLANFHALKMPKYGKVRRDQAELALKNFYRHPGTRLFEKMVDGTDSYRSVLFQKPL